jgi:prepilin-type N-terminal cleavage/methylation domain-containing protein
MYKKKDMQLSEANLQSRLRKLKANKRPSVKDAFTLIEILIVVGILTLIIAIAIPALSTSKGDTRKRSAEARAKVLNEARDRAILSDVGGISSREQWDSVFGSPTNSTNAVENAAGFLLSNNLVRFDQGNL